MAAFGLNLDSPLLPNVDAYINPTKDEDAHRSALNAVVSECHIRVCFVASLFLWVYEYISHSWRRTSAPSLLGTVLAL